MKPLRHALTGKSVRICPSLFVSFPSVAFLFSLAPHWYTIDNLGGSLGLGCRLLSPHWGGNGLLTGSGRRWLWHRLLMPGVEIWSLFHGDPHLVGCKSRNPKFAQSPNPHTHGQKTREGLSGRDGEGTINRNSPPFVKSWSIPRLNSIPAFEQPIQTPCEVTEDWEIHVKGQMR
jgi:hypothetical protein